MKEAIKYSFQGAEDEVSKKGIEQGKAGGGTFAHALLYTIYGSPYEERDCVDCVACGLFPTIVGHVSGPTTPRPEHWLCTRYADRIMRDEPANLESVTTEFTRCGFFGNTSYPTHEY